MAPKYDSRDGYYHVAHLLNAFGVSTFVRFCSVWYLTAHAFLPEPPVVIDIVGLALIFTAGITLDFIKDSHDYLKLGLPLEGDSKQVIRARLLVEYPGLVWGVCALWWAAGLAYAASRPDLLAVLPFFIAIGVTYKWLKRLPLAKNVIMPSISVSGALVVPAYLYGVDVDPRGILVIGGLMFGFETHIDIPDIHHDRLEGSRTLAALVGERSAWYAALASVAIAFVAAASAATTTSSWLLLPVLVFWFVSILTKQRNHRFLPWYEIAILSLVGASLLLDRPRWGFGGET